MLGETKMIKTEMRPVKPHKVTKNIADLDEFELNWAVAKALGTQIYRGKRRAWLTKPYGQFDQSHRLPHWSPSTLWAQGGPIIEGEKIAVWPSENGEHDGEWCARTIDTYITYSPTPLIAAMRCFVVSRLGDELDVRELEG